MIGSILLRLISTLKYREQLSVLRRNNPSSRIDSAAFKNVSLAGHNAILSGTSLDKVDLGEFSYVSNNSRLVNVVIGKFCSIGPKVQIGLAPHPSRIYVSTYPGFYSNSNSGCPSPFRDDVIFDDSVKKTMIEHDVWIGSDVIIPGGITIATGAIVAAGSVVVKDVPPYTIVGGNPACEIRKRFSEEDICFLLNMRWWEWPIDKIRREVLMFSDISLFKKSCIK